MIRLIWQNWWRNKERFLLLIIGAFIISAGLTYLVGLSDVNRGTVTETLQESWTASYDIVVRPEGTRSHTETQGLLEPNYLSGMSGGISLEQYDTIKSIENVEVAAPIAMIGFADYQVNFDPIEVEENGIYRWRKEEIVNNGVQDLVRTSAEYFPIGFWNPYENSDPSYGVVAPPNFNYVYEQTLLAGIDPEQEAKLIGLDEAIVSIGNSRYFNMDDEVRTQEDQFGGGFTTIDIPIIVSNHTYLDKEVSFILERLNYPFDSRETADGTMEQIKEAGGQSYLDTVDGTEVARHVYSSEEAFRIFINTMAGVDLETGEPVTNNSVHEAAGGSWITMRPSPLEYHAVSSPYPERWPYSYQAVTHLTNEDAPQFVREDRETFRVPETFGQSADDWPRINPDWIGFYDPSRLNISTDPTNELPMETYRPATADLVIDAERNPINPPIQLKPTDNPYDFLSNPPGMLTTIEAAEEILGDEPISAIRVKAAGVSEVGEDSQEILDNIVAAIESETGLITDITLGSSPQPTLTHIPQINDREELGWFQQPWVNIGSSISIFRETNIGFLGVVTCVFIVAIVYIWASNLVSLLARRKEFAILLAVGWRPGQLARLLFTEAVIVGGFVAVVSWTLLGTIYLSSNIELSPIRFLLTGSTGFGIYILGALFPTILVRRIAPYEAMRSGEISKTSKRTHVTKGIFSMAYNHFMGKWKRGILSVAAIALPTSLLAIFIYITYRLQGIMYATWLGQYAALEIGPTHFMAIGVASIIAILTTAEIMWQNISERKEEISLLKAVGWQNSRIRMLILYEGLLTGVFAALIGITLAFLGIWSFYQQFPLAELPVLLLTGIVPLAIGLLGTVIPAEKAVRMLPYQGMGGRYTTIKKAEKQMKTAVISFSLLIMAGFGYILIQIVPTFGEIQQSSTNGEGSDIIPTQGDLVERNETERTEEEEEDTEEEENIQTVNANQFDGYTEEGEPLSGWSHFDFIAERIEVKEDDGSKVVTVEFEFINKDTHQIDLRTSNFSLVTTEGNKRANEVEIIESKEWEDEHWLHNDGILRAHLSFILPEGTETNGFLFRSSREFRNGFYVNFE
ncbi:ABC transporter permease [Evansella halocellulosilytica]|uniref:ABC transporter permease n=1 Tax=Evansella halocellulosilytica TaxID=2011013 RepID=UPI000BB8B75F|nr:FtsX-like permease family protein [Evansella halocellulosilytica]